MNAVAQRSFTIRRATASDAATLARLAEKIFRDTFAASNRPEDLEAYISQAYGEAQQRHEIERSDYATLLVEAEGELLAFAQLRRTESEHGEVEISRFYVDGQHHGRGIAPVLMDASYDVAKEWGATTIWLGVWEHNPRAIRFYEKCGYRDVGSHAFLLGSDLQTDRLMARPLAQATETA